EEWVAEASAAGARVLAGGQRDGSGYQASVLHGAREGMKVMDCEIFGPVVSVLPFRDLDEAIAGANATEFGLSVGFFSQDIDRALRAATSLRFGSVHLNQASSYRADSMPFGGVKSSGIGHEGPFYAVRNMSEERLVTFNP